MTKRVGSRIQATLFLAIVLLGVGAFVGFGGNSIYEKATGLHHSGEISIENGVPGITELNEPGQFEVRTTGGAGTGQGDAAGTKGHKTGRLEIRVQRAGQGVPNSSVVITRGRFDSWGRQYQVRTDLNGAVTMPKLDPGSWTVSAPLGSTDVVDLIAGASVEILLTLPEGEPVLGIVVDHEGGPVAGADVRVSKSIDGQQFLVAKSGPKGLFKIEACSQTLLIGARASGHAPSAMKSLALASGGVMRLVLGGGAATLGGAVEDPLGTPIPDAMITLRPNSMERLPGTLGIASGLRAKTDQRGKFDFGTTWSGSPEIRVEAKGFATWRGTVLLAEDENRILRVTLQPESFLTGKVLRGDGSYVSGASVSVEGGPLVRTNEEGLYRLVGLSAGRVTVAVKGPKSPKVLKVNTLLALGKNQQDLVLPVPALLEVQVVGESDLGLEGLLVAGTLNGEALGSAVSDAGGRLRLSLWPPMAGSLHLVVCISKTNLTPIAELGVAIEGVNEVVTVRVNEAQLPSAFVVGRAVDLRTAKKPLPSLSVTLRNTEGPSKGVKKTMTLKDGVVRFGPLAPGSYQPILHSGESHQVLESFSLSPNEEFHREWTWFDPGYVLIKVAGASQCEVVVIDALGEAMYSEQGDSESSFMDGIEFGVGTYSARLLVDNEVQGSASFSIGAGQRTRVLLQPNTPPNGSD